MVGVSDSGPFVNVFDLPGVLWLHLERHGGLRHVSNIGYDWSSSQPTGGARSSITGWLRKKIHTQTHTPWRCTDVFHFFNYSSNQNVSHFTEFAVFVITTSWRVSWRVDDSPTGCRRAHAYAPLGDYGLTWRQEGWENHHPTSVVLRRHHRNGIITTTQKVIITSHHITWI